MTELPPRTKAYTLDAIVEAKLLRFEPTTRISGVVAPFYFDIRRAQSYPKQFRDIANGFEGMVQNSEVGKSALLAGIPEAGTPFASILGYNLKRKLVQPRKAIKEHGEQKSVEGVYEPGEKVILIDDVVTRGDSKLTAIKQVEDAGLSVEEIIVLIDHEQGGIETVQEAGYNIRAIFGITTLINHLFEIGQITPDQRDKALEFVRNS